MTTIGCAADAVKFFAKASKPERAEAFRAIVGVAREAAGDTLTKTGEKTGETATKAATGFWGRIKNFFSSLFGGGSKVPAGEDGQPTKKAVKAIMKQLKTKNSHIKEHAEGLKGNKLESFKEALETLKEAFTGGDKDEAKEAYKKLKKEGLLDAFA